MKKYGKNDEQCISVCNFEETGKIRERNGKKEEQSKCVGCGYECWITMKEKKDEM